MELKYRVITQYLQATEEMQEALSGVARKGRDFTGAREVEYRLGERPHRPDIHLGAEGGLRGVCQAERDERQDRRASG